ncbi:hypothetical protein [Burkholderia pseudomallei]|uniref:hypothetical protein n=1 Tax=Burkholderia pseudomallei TaxID=28450 RepID=UPI003EF35D1D
MVDQLTDDFECVQHRVVKGTRTVCVHVSNFGQCVDEYLDPVIKILRQRHYIRVVDFAGRQSGALHLVNLFEFGALSGTPQCSFPRP